MASRFDPSPQRTYFPQISPTLFVRIDVIVGINECTRYSIGTARYERGRLY